MLRPQLELEEAEAASVPHADPETIKKVPPCGVARSSIEWRQAEEVVKMLTQQIQNLETNTAAAIEQQEDEEEMVVDPLSACVLPVRPARRPSLSTQDAPHSAPHSAQHSRRPSAVDQHSLTGARV